MWRGVVHSQRSGLENCPPLPHQWNHLKDSTTVRLTSEQFSTETFKHSRYSVALNSNAGASSYLHDLKCLETEEQAHHTPKVQDDTLKSQRQDRSRLLTREVMAVVKCQRLRKCFNNMTLSNSCTSSSSANTPDWDRVTES